MSITITHNNNLVANHQALVTKIKAKPEKTLNDRVFAVLTSLETTLPSSLETRRRLIQLKAHFGSRLTQEKLQAIALGLFILETIEPAISAEKDEDRYLELVRSHQKLNKILADLVVSSKLTMDAFEKDLQETRMRVQKIASIEPTSTRLLGRRRMRSMRLPTTMPDNLAH